jgi:hypothetical protein
MRITRHHVFRDVRMTNLSCAIVLHKFQQLDFAPEDALRFVVESRS